MNEQWSREHFTAQLNTIFKVPTAAGTFVELKLTKLENRDSPGLDAFSLIFTGPREPVLPDATHSLQHETIGSQELFLSPYRQTADKTFYDVQFTRVLDYED